MHRSPTRRRRRALARLALALLLLPSLALPADASAACAPQPGYSSTVAGTGGLTGYWRLGEASGTVACEVRGAHPGEYRGGVTLGTPGLIAGDADGAATLDGASGYVNVADSPALDLTSAFTLEAWVRPSANPAAGAYRGIVGKRGAYFLSQVGDRFVTGFPGVAWQEVRGATPVVAGSAYHVVATFDGAALRLYVNGALDATRTVTGAPADSAYALAVGRYAHSGEYYPGTIDEAAVYSRALGATEVAAHHDAGRGIAAPPGAPSGLVATGRSGAVSLAWQAPAGAAPAGYRVYRRAADGTWPSTPLATTATTSYTDRTVQNGTAYTYRVTAYDADGGESAPSAEATATPVASGLPDGFEVVTIASGLTKPTAMTFAPDGRMFVAEKNGLVKAIPAGSTQGQVILDLRAKVNQYSDRGLLGIATDRDFAQNGWLYLLYTYELDPLAPDNSGPGVSRLTRVTVKADNTVANPADPETVILGSYASGPCPNPPANEIDCIPADFYWHNIGTVRSDPADGTLWVGSGDTTPQRVEESAYETYDERSFAGKILHVDRQGRGLADHPFCPTDADLAHACTKVYAKGFRNPFRFTLREGKGPVVGDVGAGDREEVDLLRPGGNYGWPCYEGDVRTDGYVEQPRCQEEYAREGTPGAAVGPNWTYDHGNGASLTAGPVITGNAYPAEYQGDVFATDYVQGWMKHLDVDAQDRVTRVQDFAATGFGGIVDMQLTDGGELAYVHIGGFQVGQGTIRKLVYSPDNAAPVARASATPTSGQAPLEVAFRGSDSSDPDGDPLTYSWDFGDGSEPSALADPTHVYTGPGRYTARLTVDDGSGRRPSATVEITVAGDERPQATIASPADESLFRYGRTIELRGTGVDAEDGALSGASLRWQVILHHGTHTHDHAELTGEAVSFAAGQDHDADSFYEIRLIATDSRGQTDTETIELRPQTVQMTFASEPPGAPITYDGNQLTAPATRTAASGFRGTLSAAESFVADGRTYVFDRWSDGGARLHEIEIPDAATTLTATYRLEQPLPAGLSEVAPASVGSADPTAFASNRHVAVTSAGRRLAVHGRAGSGLQLAWADPGGAWQTRTQGSARDGQILSGTGHGDWPASIAVARDAAGTQRAWVVAAPVGHWRPGPVYLWQLRDVHSKNGPRVGPRVTVDAPALGAYRADIAFERAPDGRMRGVLVWSRKTASSAYEIVTGWLTDLGSETPAVVSRTVLLADSQAERYATVVGAPGGMTVVGRVNGGRLRAFRHAPSAPLESWSAGAYGASVGGRSAPAAVALGSGELLVAVESDTTARVTTLQRWSASLATVATDATLSSWSQPTLASDGRRAWVVGVRAGDGSLVSREWGSAGGWSGADRVEVDALASGGNHAWPNLVREAGDRLGLVVRGVAAAGGGSASVVAYERAIETAPAAQVEGSGGASGGGDSGGSTLDAGEGGDANALRAEEPAIPRLSRARTARLVRWALDTGLVLACPASASGSCTVRAYVESARAARGADTGAGRRVRARAAFTLRPGATRSLRIALPASVRRRLRGGGTVDLTIRVQAPGASGRTLLADARFSVAARGGKSRLVRLRRAVR